MIKAPLREVAPPKPASLRLAPQDEVWHLGLEHIEADTGSIVKRVTAPAAQAGNSTFAFDEGNVLYSKLRPYLNKVVCPDSHGIATTELVAMRPFPDRLDRRYLTHYLRSSVFVSYISGQVSGAKMPRVNMDTFWKHEIPLPPLPEQKRIADILDKADAIRRKRAQALELTDQFLQSVFLHKVGPRAKSYTSWNPRRIEEVAADVPRAMRTGPFGSNLKHSEFVSKGIAVLGIDNAVKNRFAWDERRYITEEKYEILKNYTVRPRDVIVTIMGTTGRSAVVPENIPTAISTKHLATITVNSDVCLPEFLSFSIHSHPAVLDQIRIANKGAIMNGLNLGIIRNIEIKFPPPEVQQEFVDIYRRVETQRDDMLTGSERTDRLFSSLVQRAFRGDL